MSRSEGEEIVIAAEFTPLTTIQRDSPNRREGNAKTDQNVEFYVDEIPITAPSDDFAHKNFVQTGSPPTWNNDDLVDERPDVRESPDDLKNVSYFDHKTGTSVTKITSSMFRTVDFTMSKLVDESDDPNEAKEGFSCLLGGDKTGQPCLRTDRFKRQYCRGFCESEAIDGFGLCAKNADHSESSSSKYEVAEGRDGSSSAVYVDDADFESDEKIMFIDDDVGETDTNETDNDASTNEIGNDTMTNETGNDALMNKSGNDTMTLYKNEKDSFVNADGFNVRERKDVSSTDKSQIDKWIDSRLEKLTDSVIRCNQKYYAKKDAAVSERETPPPSLRRNENVCASPRNQLHVALESSIGDDGQNFGDSKSVRKSSGPMKLSSKFDSRSLEAVRGGANSASFFAATTPPVSSVGGVSTNVLSVSSNIDSKIGFLSLDNYRRTKSTRDEIVLESRPAENDADEERTSSSDFSSKSENACENDAEERSATETDPNNDCDELTDILQSRTTGRVEWGQLDPGSGIMYLPHSSGMYTADPSVAAKQEKLQAMRAKKLAKNSKKSAGMRRASDFPGYKAGEFSVDELLRYINGGGKNEAKNGKEPKRDDEQTNSNGTFKMKKNGPTEKNGPRTKKTFDGEPVDAGRKADYDLASDEPVDVRRNAYYDLTSGGEPVDAPRKADYDLISGEPVDVGRKADYDLTSGEPVDVRRNAYYDLTSGGEPVDAGMKADYDLISGEPVDVGRKADYDLTSSKPADVGRKADSHLTSSEPACARMKSNDDLANNEPVYVDGKPHNDLTNGEPVDVSRKSDCNLANSDYTSTTNDFLTCKSVGALGKPPSSVGVSCELVSEPSLSGSESDFVRETDFPETVSKTDDDRRRAAEDFTIVQKKRKNKGDGKSEGNVKIATSGGDGKTEGNVKIATSDRFSSSSTTIYGRVHQRKYFENNNHLFKQKTYINNVFQNAAKISHSSDDSGYFISRGVRPSGDRIKGYSPSGDRIKSSSHPSGDEIESSSPSGDRIKSSSHPSGYEIESSSPSGDRIKSSSPSGDRIKSSSPSGDVIKRSRPSGDDIKSLTASNPRPMDDRGADPTGGRGHGADIPLLNSRPSVQQVQSTKLATSHPCRDDGDLVPRSETLPSHSSASNFQAICFNASCRATVACSRRADGTSTASGSYISAVDGTSLGSVSGALSSSRSILPRSTGAPTVGSTDAPKLTVGLTDAVRPTVGSTERRPTVGSTDTSKPNFRSTQRPEASGPTVWSTDALRHTVGSTKKVPRPTFGLTDIPKPTVISSDSLRLIEGSSTDDALRLTVDSTDSSRPTFRSTDASSDRPKTVGRTSVFFLDTREKSTLRSNVGDVEISFGFDPDVEPLGDVETATNPPDAAAPPEALQDPPCRKLCPECDGCVVVVAAGLDVNGNRRFNDDDVVATSSRSSNSCSSAFSVRSPLPPGPPVQVVPPLKMSERQDVIDDDVDAVCDAAFDVDSFSSIRLASSSSSNFATDSRHGADRKKVVVDDLPRAFDLFHAQQFLYLSFSQVVKESLESDESVTVFKPDEETPKWSESEESDNRLV